MGTAPNENTVIKHAMLKDFMNAIMDHSIPEIEANNDLPDDVVRLFVSISRQIDNGRSIYEVIDASGRTILNNPTPRANIRDLPREGTGYPIHASQPSPLLLQEAQRVVGQDSQRSAQAEIFGNALQRLIGNIATSINANVSARRPIDRNAVGGLIADMNNLYQSMPETRRDSQMDNTQPFNGSPYIQPVTQPMAQPVDRQLDRQEAMPMRQEDVTATSGSLGGLFRLMTAMSNPDRSASRSTNPNIDAILSQNEIAAMNTNVLRDTGRPGRTLRNTSNPQPYPEIEHVDEIKNTEDPVPMPESEMPERFREVRTGPREVIMNPSTRTDDTNVDVDVSVPDSTESKQIIATLPHIASRQNPPINREILIKLASHINQLIITGKTRHPDFTNLNKSGYRKIKNYIHNITGMWLSQEEINMFVTIMDELNKPSLNGHHMEDPPLD